MYQSYLQVKDSKNGKGVFTSVKIPAKSPVCIITGEFFTDKELHKYDYNYVLQIGKNTYLGPSGGVDDYINHSCNPNCYLHVVGNRAMLFSLYDIPINVEITFDYSTSSTDTLDSWKMECHCNSAECRKVISGYQYLSDATKEDYTKRGIVPMFITMDIFSKQ